MTSLAATVPTVLHVVADLGPHSGGPARVITGLADALSLMGTLQIGVMTQLVEGEACLRPTSPAVEFDAVPLRTKTLMASGLRDALHRRAGAPGVRIIHSHGLWLAANHWAATAARSAHSVLVIQPHGMLHPWAMKHRRWKKWLAMQAFQWRDLQAARALVATSQEELEHIRALGLEQPVAVIPNGITLPAVVAARAGTTAGDRPRTALFMGRIHPVKGLPHLVQAWAAVRPPNWRLKIAGPDDAGHLRQVMDLARELNVVDLIEYVGPISDEAKPALFREADLFILPSLSENFGLVVAEALSYGLPVITTTGTPWSELVEHEAGWWIEPGAQPLARAVRLATSATDSERRDMGARGRGLAARYGWQSIAAEMASLYLWLMGQAEQPRCVQ
jgi:glycosyltransferase involved in cell wall biosynthesis